MAKISARGATEVARWRNDSGVQYLLRSDKVLLRRLGVSGDGWTIVSKRPRPLADLDKAFTLRGFRRA